MDHIGAVSVRRILPELCLPTMVLMTNEEWVVEHSLQLLHNFSFANRISRLISIADRMKKRSSIIHHNPLHLHVDQVDLSEITMIFMHLEKKNPFEY